MWYTRASLEHTKASGLSLTNAIIIVFNINMIIIYAEDYLFPLNFFLFILCFHQISYLPPVLLTLNKLHNVNRNLESVHWFSSCMYLVMISAADQRGLIAHDIIKHRIRKALKAIPGKLKRITGVWGKSSRSRVSVCIMNWRLKL